MELHHLVPEDKDEGSERQALVEITRAKKWPDSAFSFLEIKERKWMYSANNVKLRRVLIQGR